MSKVYSSSPVPRQFVFIMADGSFVVQWDNTRVQDLLTGKYRTFTHEGFGHHITDDELNQLKAAGRVEHFNRSYVWLYALPEGKRFDAELKTLHRSRGRVRVYYLNTTLAKVHLDQVRALLEKLELGDQLYAQERDDLIAILGKNGMPFSHLPEVEAAQRKLLARAPDVFKNAVVAFVETAQNTGHSNEEHAMEPDDLEMVIASQTDISVTTGKCAVLVGGMPEEQAAIENLCAEIGMAMQSAATGAQGLQLLEDLDPDLLLMDLRLPDMHGWEMLGKVKEITSLRNLPIIVMADHAASEQQSFALTVARVDVYLVKPVSMAKLRQNIWMALKQRAR